MPSLVVEWVSRLTISDPLLLGPHESLTWGTFSDLLVNICLTLLGYLPGHIHAFYIEYIYYDRREQAREGRIVTGRAPGVYSDRVQSGGQGYGTIAQGTA